jgi:hypothetical protein
VLTSQRGGVPARLINVEADSADVIRSLGTPLDWAAADLTPDLVTEPGRPWLLPVAAGAAVIAVATAAALLAGPPARQQPAVTP